MNINIVIIWFFVMLVSISGGGENSQNVMLIHVKDESKKRKSSLVTIATLATNPAPC